MTISSSLNAGVAGLAANASRLATISDNIANSGTNGYKRVETNFESLVVSSSGGSGRYSAGGVSTSTIRLVDNRGSITSTDNKTDLAIGGRGFFPVASATEVKAANGKPQMFLTTTGSFRQDEAGYLKTASGLVLMGWPADANGNVPFFPRDSSDGLQPIQVNNQKLIGEPTTNIDLKVNLPATGSEAGPTLLADRVKRMSSEYYDNLGISQTLSYEFTPTIPATGFSNEWTMVVTDSAQPGVTVGEYNFTFNNTPAAGGTPASITAVTGGAYDPVTGEVVINVASGPMTLKLGHLGSDDGFTQLSDEFLPTSIKNGSPVGTVVDVTVDESGAVLASFNTGVTRQIFQVPVVDLPNPNGLIAIDQQTYQPSPKSGPFYLWDAGSGPTGSVVSSALEASATDVAGELTDLIQTQRAYSSNAKVIQTVDEMLQETTNIKR